MVSSTFRLCRLTRQFGKLRVHTFATFLEEGLRADSFAGIRITGDGTFLVSTDQWESGVDYECLADAEFKGRRITALCTYSLATVSPDRLAEVLRGHSCGLVQRNEKWDEIRPGSGVATAIEFFQSVPL